MGKKNSKVKNNSNKNQNKHRKNNKTLLILCTTIVLALIISGISIFLMDKTPDDIKNTAWKSVSAYDANNKKVDIESVYDNYYSSYQGSMNLKEGNEFSFWMGVGNPDDGTHKGTYKYNKKDDTINATFDIGEKVVFKIIRNKDNSIKRIEAPYDDYTVYFVQK